MSAFYYYKEFSTETEAKEWARMKTRAHSRGDQEIFCVLEGPDGNWVVADLRTATETGLPYSWSYA